MDLFEMYKMPEFTEFPVLPKELLGIDIEPDYLPPINVESDRIYQFICINYDAGEAKLLNDMVGYSFLRKKRNTFYYEEILSRKHEQANVYENETSDYILILFQPHELDDVMKMFHLPFYEKNNTYKVKDLLSNVTMQF